MAKKKRTKNISETPRRDAFDAAWAKYRPLVPSEELASLEACLHQSPAQTIRLNPLKTGEKTLSNMTERYGMSFEPISFCPEGQRVLSAETQPGRTAEHRGGYFYIQDSASMLPAMLYDAERLTDSPLILDLAASPGGKTTHLAARSMDRGLIIANDSSVSRIPALKTVMKNWGSLNHAVTQFPGESYGEWFPNTFDLVLLDAPCSMQSLVSIDSHPMRPITEREEKALAQRQTALLKSALSALKPGGQLVYSTCTLSPDEDEAVVDAVLKAFPGRVHVADAAGRIPYPAPGVTEAYGTSYDPAVKGAVRLWPHRYGTAGFFACLLEKTDAFSYDIPDSSAPVRPWSKSGYSDVKPAVIADLAAWLDDQLGLDLDALCTEYGMELYARGDEFWMLPSRYAADFSTLPSKSVGMRMAVRTAGGFVPDNDWVCRFFSRAAGIQLVPDDEQILEWVNGGDIRPDCEKLPKGQIVLIKDAYGIFLGCGKISGDRVRNFNK